ncbi:MAG: ATP-dependent RNA helicase [Gammaproteobacteria bacterium CG_4_9_14_3_um_filter_38_9]|nr:MAG: ATP-dependent RNA helicase [Gammaproteobacteria bacterium CG_4_9_14_3_um_filter_38_9]
MNFDSLGLSAPILKALDEQGYKTPSPIQLKAIPAIMEGRDVMAAAQTGTGKTAGFTLPILQQLSQGESVQPGQVRTLVLTPTRELAAQVAQSVATYGKNLSLRTAVVFGGVSINPQINALRKGVDILVATPGRLLDLYQQRAMQFHQLSVLVLDEADRMLDMGFIHDIKKIMALLPRKRQNLMFSATFSNEIRALVKGMMNNPVEISVTPPNSTVTSIEQWVCPVDKKQKAALLSHLIWENRWEQVLVFARTKHGANRLAEFLLENDIPTLAIHGNKSQGARTKALANFKSGTIRVLVATDIAARGLDIELLPHVVNFDLPNIPEDYVHRIGRTGRAGATGEAISLVSADEVGLLRDIERLIKKTLPRKTIDSFEPSHVVPKTESVKLDSRPRRDESRRPSSRPNSRSRFEKTDSRPSRDEPRRTSSRPNSRSRFEKTDSRPSRDEPRRASSSSHSRFEKTDSRPSRDEPRRTSSRSYSRDDQFGRKDKKDSVEKKYKTYESRDRDSDARPPRKKLWLSAKKKTSGGNRSFSKKR